MSISKYVDQSTGEEFFKVEVIRKSKENRMLVVRKRAYGIKKESEAQKVERSLNIEAERELVAKEAKSCSWQILVEEFELAVRRKDIFARELTPSALSEYLGVIRKFTHDWMDLPVDDIDKAKAWLVLDRTERDWNIARRKRLRTAIDAVYSWGFLSGRIKKTVSIPTEGYRGSKREEEKLPEILNLDEIRRLLAYAKEIKHHWYPVWALALYTGMRSGELYALGWDSVDFDNRTIYVHRNWTNKVGIGATKGRYWRAVPLNEELINFLKELKLNTGKTGFVLPRFQSWTDGRQAEILRSFCKGSGIPSVKFHTLRACFATQLIKDGVAPAVVMKICGWKDLKTMQRYIRLAGIEVKGATDGLKLLSEEKVVGRVIQLFGE